MYFDIIYCYNFKYLTLKHLLSGVVFLDALYVFEDAEYSVHTVESQAIIKFALGNATAGRRIVGIGKTTTKRR